MRCRLRMHGVTGNGAVVVRVDVEQPRQSIGNNQRSINTPHTPFGWARIASQRPGRTWKEQQQRQQ